MGETAHPAVRARGIFEIKRCEGVCEPAAGVDFESLQERLTDEMRWLRGHVCHAQGDARFTEVSGQELGVAVREMHQRHIVAKLMQIVEAVDCTRALRVDVERKAGCCGYTQCVQEFASGHRHKKLSAACRRMHC